MTYIVTDACVRCKLMDCIEVCPVDCFYEGENFLVIHPEECIDCGVCEPECPAEAIVKEIRELSGLASGHRLTCHAAKALTEQHIADIRRKVKDLRRLERVLNDLASRCHGNEMPDCPILEALGDRGVVSNVLV